MLLLTLRETYTLNMLSSFQNPRRKGGKFDHRPERPKVLLRHWIIPKLQSNYDGRLLYKTSYEGHEDFLRYSSLAIS